MGDALVDIQNKKWSQKNRYNKRCLSGIYWKELHSGLKFIAFGKVGIVIIKTDIQNFFGLKSPFFFYLITAIFSSSFALFRHGELWSRIWSGSRAWWIWPFNYILTNIGAKSFWEYFSFFLQAVYELEYTSSSIIRPEVCGLYLKEVNIKEQVVMGIVRCTFY